MVQTSLNWTGITRQAGEGRSQIEATFLFLHVKDRDLSTSIAHGVFVSVLGLKIRTLLADWEYM